MKTIADFPIWTQLWINGFSSTNNPIPKSLGDFNTYISRSISWVEFLVDGTSINRQQAVGKSRFAYLRFFDHLMTFSEVCAPLKLSESTQFFFQPRHIEYALGVKNVVRARRATQRVERASRKKMLSFTTGSHDSEAEERELIYS